jgi:uncharacterized protein YjbI with pentapeptide repeats
LLVLVGLWILVQLVARPGTLSSWPDEWRLFNRSLWDWMELLFIPGSLLVGGFFLHRAQRQTGRQLSEQRSAAKQNLVQDQSHDSIFDSFMARMTDLLLERDLLNSPTDSSLRDLARNWTITTVRRLDGQHNSNLFRFLEESRLVPANLPAGESPVIQFDGANLSDVDLRHANLSSVNLKGAELARAKLADADFRTANLARADLREADLSRANLQEANLSQAILWEADLSGAFLKEAVLNRAFLRDTTFIRAQLREAVLTRANLTRSVMRRANLSGANLASANLTGADLTGAFLQKADLRKANLTRAKLIGADLTGANLLEATLPDGTRFSNSTDLDKFTHQPLKKTK